MNLFFFFCVSLSCLHFACVFVLSRFFGCFGFVFCLFPFFRLSSCFSRFSLFFFVFASSFLFIRFKRFECFLHISRQLLSIVPQSSATGNCKNPKKKGISLRPRLHGLCLIRNIPSDAPFSRLRPNEESSGLTNDTKEDPITESHRPIANRNSPNIF